MKNILLYLTLLIDRISSKNIILYEIGKPAIVILSDFITIEYKDDFYYIKTGDHVTYSYSDRNGMDYFNVDAIGCEYGCIGLYKNNYKWA
jgi:hypothetical protein